MAKSHGGNRRRRGTTRPLQGILLVLVILSASLDFVASFDPELIGDLFHSLAKYGLTVADKVVSSGRIKPAEKYKSLIKGAKAGDKTYEWMEKLRPAGTGSTAVWVDAVRIQGDRWLPVTTADITATVAANVSSCHPTAAAIRVPTTGIPIDLLGQLQGAVLIKSLPSATFVDCLAGGAATSTVLGLGWGGDLVPRYATTFSYVVLQLQGTGGGYFVNTFVSFPQPRPAGRQSTPLVINSWNPNLYSVRITGILVGGRNIMPAPPAPLVDGRLGGTGGVTAYLSTTETFTRLDPLVFLSFKLELVRNLQVARVLLVPAPPYPYQLCYYKGAAVKIIPTVAIVFDGGAVMQLSAANVLQNVNQYISCFSILPTSPGEPSVLGTLLQTGWAMTIQLGPGGLMQRGTLTIEKTPPLAV